ncbi:sorbosone dehydrogenase family protein [Reichenbachiella agariperforans]|uniref:Glucose/arabinose dehydrogenase, beta-propeller fold n=2 Tax=Reichenbachiella agariperforans TaxID=156994 RepID=A0A1M6UZL1_REIAG|nr:sorbosone dehydrogenase family protein [Reichenbachiella agariperforans]SHK74638.1 Glucose/arabinose dehydrogenase, beta-propeller fold [Reichenbachiella agariperforans]
MKPKMKNLITYLPLLAWLTISSSCASTETGSEQPADESDTIEEPTGQLATLKLPEGFRISVYADGVENARSMAVSPSGVLYVGTKDAGKVYAIKDTDGDGQADEVITLLEGQNMPNGIAFRDGSLYVAEVDQLTRYDDIEQQLDALGEGTVIYDDYPSDKHHGWKYIAFGPDGKLYIPVGAPCNICESKDEIYASITRMNPDGSDREIYAHGVRNSVGITWDSAGTLWFTDNGRDLLGDDMPPCELNKATKLGQHFGYPYCHGGDIADPEFGAKFPCSDFVIPARKLGAHVAPLGLKFYNGEMFPQDYRGSIIIAEHGSWNRSKKVGYRLTQVKVQDGKAISYEPFVEGWLDVEEQEAWGRPVDVLVLDDGSLLVSDDKAGKIYRISYSD